MGAAVVWFQGFVSVDTTSVQPYSLFDTVPADVAASLIIGAAAALAARIDLSTIPGPNVRVEPGQILAKPQVKKRCRASMSTSPMSRQAYKPCYDWLSRPLNCTVGMQ